MARHARVAVYKFTPGGADEVIRQAEAGMLPIFRQHEGFRSYTVIKTGNDSGISISVWDSEGQALEATQAAAKWVQKNVASLIVSVENHVGEVAFSHRESIT